MTGRICVITGSNSGIGFATAGSLAGMGATIVMVCRNESRGIAARDRIITSSGANPQNLDLVIADLSSFEAVRHAAADLSSRYTKLHVLINNAGLILSKRIPTVDGLETTFQVNYLAHFLLTSLLLPLLKAGAPSRVINVSSDAHRSGEMNFEDLEGAKHYSGMGAYCQSKLAQVLFTHELAKMLDGSGVTVNALHPGAVASNWGRHSAGALSFALKLVGPFEKSIEKGAETPIYLASDPEVQNVTGKYFSNRKEVPSSKRSYDVNDSERLWRESEALVRVP